MKQQAKLASHEWVVQSRRRMLTLQQMPVTTVNKSPSMNVETVIKETMIILLDSIKRQEEENLSC